MGTAIATFWFLLTEMITAQETTQHCALPITTGRQLYILNVAFAFFRALSALFVRFGSKSRSVFLHPLALL